MIRLPDTMKAAAIEEFGAPVRIRSLEVPEPRPDEILVRVETAGVGVWDEFEREGGFARIYGGQARFPYVLGSDGAGTVAAAGRDVSRFKPGDRVYGMSLASSRGFYAEYAPIKADHAALVPAGVPLDQAGAMAVDGITALRGLERLAFRPGEWILVFGASGGVGHLALQLARRMGARVLAAASGPDGLALARSLGADAAVDGKNEDVAAAARAAAPQGLAAALLTAGGEPAQRALQALRPGGLVAYPHGVEPEPKVPPTLQAEAYDGEPDPEAFRRLNALIESGPFVVHISKALPLERAAEAHALLHEHHLGKLALKP